MAVDVELATNVSDAGMSPLYLAVMGNLPHIVNALLQHSPSFGFARRRKPIPKWKLGRIVDELDSTTLHYVAADGDEKVACILLEHDASMAYISDKDGYFPIHDAAGMGHAKIIDELLKHCSDSFDLLDDYNGRNFLHIAAEKMRVDVVTYVCNTKIRIFEKPLNQRDNIVGNTRLHLVVSNYKHDNYKAAAALLKDPRVETSIINNQGRTQLDLCAKLEPGMGYRHVSNIREINSFTSINLINMNLNI
ncbi:putative ankyrin repeat-containing domain-containing protein [Dioscorea sansibarensis]